VFHHYGEASIGAGCWVVSRCVDGHCISWPNGWVFAGFPTIFMFISIVANNCIIYYHVRRKSLPDASSPGTGKVRQEDIKVQAVATQAFGYVGSFLLCYTSCFAIKGIESFGRNSSSEKALYPLLMMTSIVLPLQGFFNMVVYCRPSYLRIRSRFPMKSRRWAIRHALLATDLSPLQEHGIVNASSIKSGSQTSVCTAMDSSSFYKWNSSGRHSSQRPRSAITSVLVCSVDENGEESDGSDHAMRSNLAEPQPNSLAIVKERQRSYELFSIVEADYPSGSLISEEIVVYSDGDSSILSSSRCDDDSIDTQLCHLEDERNEEDLEVSHIPIKSTSLTGFP
jgi:hypothetical protein